MAKTVMLGEIPVGEGHPTLFMPEIGLYFGKDVEQARDSIKHVAEAGCKVIKGEIAHTADIVLNDGFIYEYVSHDGKKKSRPYREIIEELVLPMDVWYELYHICHDLGLSTVVSAYDKKSIDFIVDVKAACIKISSNNIINVPLIRYAGETGLPVMMDTGKANLEEVAKAVDVLQSVNCDQFIINHAPPGHPAPPGNHHLRIIETYKSAFECPVGLADHHVSDEILYAAVGMGYDLLEKPVVPKPDEVDVDAPWTMSFSRLSEVKKKVENCWLARGLSYLPERYTREDHPARMGLITTRSVKAGEIISNETVSFAWPQRGISVYHWDLVEGGKFKISLEAGKPIKMEHVQLNSGT
jgi:sialic acid synthase SpsE